MGLFTALLTLPLAPVRGVVWIAEKMLEQAESELHDPNRIREQLAAANAALEEGQISQDDYDEIESILLDRLSTGASPVEQRKSPGNPADRRRG